MIAQLDQYFEGGFLRFLFLVAVTMAVCSALDAFSRKRIDRYNQRFAAKGVNNEYLRSTVRFLIWLVGIQIIVRQIKPLQVLGNTAMGATGIIAIAVSIAAQATFSNYIAGFFLAVHHPFKVGDVIYLKEKNIAGTVKELTFRHTVLETKTGTVITIPNTVVNSVMIEDLSSFGYSRPVEFRVPLHTDLDRLHEVIAGALSEAGVSAKDDSFRITIDEFDGKGYEVAFPLPADSLKEYVERKTKIIPILTRKLQENGIDVN